MTTTRPTCPSSGCGTLYLPPFKAAIDAGADTAMCSFNAINGVPGCGNDYLMNEILKDEWDFDGFVEGDWTAVAEMRACPPVNPNSGECGHGVAEDGPAAAELALESGVDSEMTSTLIRDFGEQLLRDRRISMKRIDDAVRRILRVKFRAGLFENPYAPYLRRQRPRRRCCGPTRSRLPGTPRAARWCS